MKKTQINAIILAILAATFYAVSIPISKLLLTYTAPTMLAAFLYLGAGIGIGIMFLFQRDKIGDREKLSKSDLPYTIGMIVLDIIAPVLLMNGVARTTAANVSLLNNFEIVATAIIAFFIFKEKISRRMWGALILVTLSSLVLSFEGTDSLRFSTGSIMVIGAAVCWGFENNCTRMISSKSTHEIVIIKGFFSGTGTLLIALIIGEKFPPALVTGIILLLGFVAYGLSIFTYIRAQEIIGAAKTSAFYALAPFIGALLSFLLLNESLSPKYAAGLIIMILGSVIAVRDTLRYSHKHIHTHTVHVYTHTDNNIGRGAVRTETVTHEHEHTHIGPGLAHHHTHRGM